MGNIFPRWINWLPLKASIVLGCVVVIGTALATYFIPANYSAVGYQPEQPIPFSHKIHVEQNGMDCRYCHSFVDRAAHSNIPSAETCWGCHKQVKTDSPQLVNLRRAMDPSYEHYDGKPIVWTQIHRTPDYVKFDHSAHINRGVSCVECHGRVDQMEVVYQAKSLTMGFCLECHRNPEKALRPLEQVTNLAWQADQDPHVAENIASLSKEKLSQIDHSLKHTQGLGEHAINQLNKERSLFANTLEEFNKLDEANSRRPIAEGLAQKQVGSILEQSWKVNPPIQCGGCHR